MCFDISSKFLVDLIEPKKDVKKDFYLYISIDNRNFDNNIMNYLLFKAVANGISPIISANYRHLAFDSIFDFSKNMFLFKTYNALKKRAILSDILQTLPAGCFIINGKLAIPSPVTFAKQKPASLFSYNKILLATYANNDLIVYEKNEENLLSFIKI